MKSCGLLGKGEINFNFDISSIIFLRYAITVWYMDEVVNGLEIIEFIEGFSTT